MEQEEARTNTASAVTVVFEFECRHKIICNRELLLWAYSH